MRLWLLLLLAVVGALLLFFGITGLRILRTAAGKDLVRSITRNLLSSTTLDVQDQPLLSGVESVKFSCFDGTQWFDAWDTTDTTTANTNLPVAVRVLIQMAGNNTDNTRPQPIQILVPIDSQSRTNT